MKKLFLILILLISVGNISIFVLAEMDSYSFCSDSDGGRNFYNKGSVRWLNYTDTDSCIDSVTLFEYYCNFIAERDGETYLCPYDCKEGACTYFYDKSEKINISGELGDRDISIVSKVFGCQGCEANENICLPIGTIAIKKDLRYYCDVSKTILKQKENKESCQNSYECLTNLCVDNKCISTGLIQKILDWFRKLFK